MNNVWYKIIGIVSLMLGTCCYAIGNTNNTDNLSGIKKDSTTNHKSDLTDNLKRFEPFANKTIGKIEIITLDPFGTSVDDPENLNPPKSTFKLGNSTHFRTRKWVIRDALFFKEGETIDPLILIENEQYMRLLSYTYDARINLIEDPDDANKVNVTVVVKDVWSLAFNPKKISLNKSEIELFDKNILGLGRGFGGTIYYNNNANRDEGDGKPFGYGLEYNSLNVLGKTYAELNAKYISSSVLDEKSVSIRRDLQAKFRYMGGTSFSETNQPYGIVELNDTTLYIKKSNFDVWGGRAFNLHKKNSNLLSSQEIVIAARYAQQNLLTNNLLTASEYTYYPYEDEQLYLLALTLYDQKLYQGRMIYNFGIVEDVPYGYNFTVQGGYSRHKYFNRPYVSLSASWGKLAKRGYHYTYAKFGTYFNHGEAEQGVLKMGTEYFSDLYSLGKQRFRNFFTLSYAKGINRLNAEGEQLSLADYLALQKEGATPKYGNELLQLQGEMNWYTSAQLLGFKFIVFAFSDIGWFSSSSSLFNSGSFFFLTA